MLTYNGVWCLFVTVQHNIYLTEARVPESTKGVPGLISLEWEKCPDGYTVGTVQSEYVRFEVEDCDDGSGHWRLLAYPTADTPNWLRETLIDDPHKNPWANSEVYGGEKEARQARGWRREFYQGNEFIVPHSTEIISHTVIEDTLGAFMEFGDCVESPDNIARFVSLYGYPTKLGDYSVNDEWIPGTQIVASSLFVEIAYSMRYAIDMWEEAKKTGDYRELKIMFEKDSFNIGVDDPIAQLNVSFRLPSDGNTPPTLSISPPDLETALWLQLAIAVTDAPEIKKCEECPTWFEVAPGKGRPEKKYCSDACSMRAYRKRVAAKLKPKKRRARQRLP